MSGRGSSDGVCIWTPVCVCVCVLLVCVAGTQHLEPGRTREGGREGVKKLWGVMGPGDREGHGAGGDQGGNRQQDGMEEWRERRCVIENGCVLLWKRDSE